MKKINIGSGKYYHRSLVSYMPSIVESGEIVPTARSDIQLEERAWRYLNKRMISDEKIRAVISRGDLRKYLRDVHNYVWISSSMDYLRSKMRKGFKKIFFDSDFVSRYDGGDPVIYVFDGGKIQKCDFYSEGVVNHHRLVRKIRATFRDINFVSKDVLPLSGVERILVGDKHIDKVEFLLSDNSVDIPVTSF